MLFIKTIALSALALFAGVSSAADVGMVSPAANIPHLPIKPHQARYPLWTGHGFRGNLTVRRDQFAAYYKNATGIDIEGSHLLETFEINIVDDHTPGEETVDLFVDPATGVEGTLTVSRATYDSALGVLAGRRGLAGREECDCGCICYALCNTAASVFSTGQLGSLA